MACSGRAAVFFLCLGIATAAAQAQDPAPSTEPAAAPEPAAPAVQPGALTHKGQFELSLRLPIGVRAIVPYDDGEYCGKVDRQTSSGYAPVCAGRAPFSIDLELGYGVSRRIDLLLELRIGLERDFAAIPAASDGPRVVHGSPGARFFFSDEGRTKLFTTAQLVFEFSGYENAAGESRGTDLGVRNMRVLSAPKQMHGLSAFGLEVTEYVD